MSQTVVATTTVESSTYTISGGPKQIAFVIAGGNGGNGTNTFGGNGATINAIYNLNNGDVIRYLVAEGGFGGSEAGGGGSTGIYINSTLILVAGGGGGGDNSANAVGFGANNTTNGDNGTVAATFTNNGSGGTAGNGGTSNSDSGGGGGINSAGGNGSSGLGGKAAKVDFTLALGGTAISGNGAGGRGLTGGGGAGNFYAAAGGGYSGGGAAGGAGSAGGGGSFVNTTFTGYVTSTIAAGANGAASGADQTNGNNGSVTITGITDIDNDGITDSIDIDDDNDGILDTEENIECTGSLNYEFYNASPASNTVDNIPTTGVTGVGTVSDFDVTALQTIVTPTDANTYSIRYTGFIKIPTTDTYTFYLNSDDGSKVYIDGNEVADYDGPHAARGPIAGTPVLLNAGAHTIEVLFFENNGQHSLIVEYSSISAPLRIPIPFNTLSPGNCDSDGDSIPNSLDLDSDNDGIPDNIEGQTTRDYLEPSGDDVDNDGLDDAYDSNLTGSANSFGITPLNTDATATIGADTVPDYLDLDSDGDTIFDIVESGSGLTNTAGRTDGIVGTNGLENTLDNGDNYTDVNGSFDSTQTDNFTDIDSDALTFGDVDYRDLTEDGIAMITQVYQSNLDNWIEITNIHSTNNIAANSIKVQLYNSKSGDQTGVSPNSTYTVNAVLTPGQSVLLGNLNNAITNINSSALRLDDTNITNFANADDIITLSSSNDANSYIHRYDIIEAFTDNTSYVRIDEIELPNITYTTNEWVAFIDNNIDAYQAGYGGDISSTKRHPQDPLISEIEDSNTQANTLLGLHQIEKTTTNANNTWDNGYPDRSRYVVIDEDYNHTGSRFSARKLDVNTFKELRITDNVLVVTNDILLDGNIRLTGTTAQLIQTHTNTSTVTSSGTPGQLFIDQNSEVPSLYRYNYMSSPVTNPGADNYSLITVFKDGTTPNDPKDITFVTGYDGSYAGGVLKLADFWIYTYATASNGRSNWEHKYRRGTIKRGDGFIFKGPGQIQNYTFVGTPNDGSFTSENEIDTGESYLIGNPFPSAINARKFIDDNIDATTGTLYFWQHVGENNNQGTAGHNFAGYIGGYASQNKITSTNAYAATPTTAVLYTLQAEDADYTGIPTSTGPTTGISLNETDYIKFENISSGVDTLKITYAAIADKNLQIKVNNVVKGEITFAGTSNNYTEKEIALCIESGSNITLTSTNDGNSIKIDQITFKDNDGYIACSSVGNDDTKYDDPQPYIAVGQGFFVVGGDTKDKIVFNNSQRAYVTEESGESVFFKGKKKTLKKTPTEELPILKLGMNYAKAKGSNFHRQIAISFNKANSFAYEKGFDSQMYDINPTDFYWNFSNDTNSYVIAGIQGISDALEVPLEIVVSKNSVITIVIDETTNINQNIYIKDKLTGKTQQINNASASYQLKTGTYTDRFVLAFTPANTTLSLKDDILTKQTSVFTDNKNHNIVISKNKEIKINTVTLFDILGKKVILWNIKEQKETYQLNIKKQIPTGIYIVKIKTDKGTINKKVLVE
ncbi:PA14 domain-containing protein [Polaribacter sp. L3A8]|uniref:PA14 domain-containing protein n=1 Tax=Polaribacter sp. L3A8 TaxID=2686361 RepID=UPI00131B5AC9|nr:PA14 domain-containing protein [Polaribacter sp. L3A8]